MPGSAGSFCRVLLKLSGQALAGDGHVAIDPAATRNMAESIRRVRATGCDLAIVVGGGNIFRGVSGAGACAAYAQSERMPARIAAEVVPAASPTPLLPPVDAVP